MLCIDILRSVPWTVVRPSGCFLLFLSCIVFLFSSAAALVANKDYYYYNTMAQKLIISKTKFFVFYLILYVIESCDK